MSDTEPIIDAAAQEWWSFIDAERMVVQECACGVRQHPPRAVCTGCGSMDALTWRDASRTGTVDAWTEVHRPPRAGFEPGYIVARVRLEEGPVMLTHLVGEGPWHSGDHVVLDWAELDGRRLPVFRRERS